MSSVESTGKTIEDAIRSGLVRLGKIRDEVDIEVLAEPKNGFLGFGSKPARVRITEKETASAQSVAADTTREENVQTEAVIPEKPVVEKATTTEIPAVTQTEQAVTEEPVVKEEFSAEDAAVQAKEFLQEVLRNMGMDVVIEKMIKSDKVILHLHGKNLGILIGKHGQTLDALQYLTNLTTNQGKETRHFIMLDVENYRRRREETLKQLAVRLADRAKRSGQRVILEPMNGYERKIIHVALQDDENIRTESEGQDPYRHVVIYYEG
ncbi:MAG: Jag N-terminal domain-containing protein [Megasphaera sp.]|jgi:spoIIIJ-associated protein|nr:Jag N-terminal domain-containing protein [Megasphaera sp.]MCH4187533.1 Jag N-terminal domain-containing protein [Megasphaera sp.]MCH4217743.1 Jag N-terminal domain-containing protein [Megasphaera sp.]